MSAATSGNGPPHVVLVTSADWPDLFIDDHPLMEALRARDVRVSVRIWDDPSARWDDADLVVLRSIWDYTRARDAFVAWAHAVERTTPMRNPARIVEWNSHKRYLRELEAQGVPVVPTAWVEAGGRVNVAAVARERGWEQVVVKPAVSAGARDTLRAPAAVAQEHADALLRARDVMIQPYIDATEGIGEHSLVHFGGRLSHVMRKDPALATEGYSSSNVVPADPHPDELRLAEQVLSLVGPLLYARVDTVVVDGVAHLMELEVIEPQLFLRAAPGSAERLAELVVAELAR